MIILLLVLLSLCATPPVRVLSYLPHTFDYGYDDACQLSSSAKDGGPATLYTYDKNGNRTGRPC